MRELGQFWDTSGDHLNEAGDGAQCGADALINWHKAPAVQAMIRKAAIAQRIIGDMPNRLVDMIEKAFNEAEESAREDVAEADCDWFDEEIYGKVADADTLCNDPARFLLAAA